jgi:hypothetical protein
MMRPEDAMDLKAFEYGTCDWFTVANLQAMCDMEDPDIWTHNVELPVSNTILEREITIPQGNHDVLAISRKSSTGIIPNSIIIFHKKMKMLLSSNDVKVFIAREKNILILTISLFLMGSSCA